jgi:hypothetical protein
MPSSESSLFSFSASFFLKKMAQDILSSPFFLAFSMPARMKSINFLSPGVVANSLMF